MPSITAVDLVVLDVLGTLVDEPGGLRTAIRDLVPTVGPEDVDHLVEVWQKYVADQQQDVLDGRRPYTGSDLLDREAAELVAARCGVTDATALDRLTAAARLPDPWPDTVEALGRLADHVPVVGLSNASPSTLMRLNAHAGLRWHYLLSAEDARSYKPDPAVYGLAVDLVGGRADRVLMVAAHAWDLRGAQALGMRTAYVRRPVGDPPVAGDSFDHHADGLAELVAALLDGG